MPSSKLRSMGYLTAGNAVHILAESPSTLGPVSMTSSASPRAVPSISLDRPLSPKLSPTSSLGNSFTERTPPFSHQMPLPQSHVGQPGNNYVHHQPSHSPALASPVHTYARPRSPAHQHLHVLHPVPAAATSANSSSSPMRRDSGSSTSASSHVAAASLALAESSYTSYSADAPPPPSRRFSPSTQRGSNFPVSDTPHTSRRRTGPLSQASRERAALIRKLGACHDCRKRRVACHPGHHNMTWEQLQGKFHKSMSPPDPSPADLAQSFSPQHRAPEHPQPTESSFVHTSHEMDVDDASTDDKLKSEAHPGQHPLPDRTPFSELRNRTPLPGGRLDKHVSLPGIETLKSDLQTSVSRMLSGSGRTRYQSVEATLITWEQDDDPVSLQGAVKELADVFDQFYHYTFTTLQIPSPSETCKSPGRWLSRKLHDFVDTRDQRDVLKIVFYAGHTCLDDNEDMLLASSRDPDLASTMRWSAVQQILEDACSDILVLLDAVYYPSQRATRTKGVLELIAASISEEHLRQLDRYAFTRALADQLRTRATRLTPLSAAELHAAILASYPKLMQNRRVDNNSLRSSPAPLYVMMTGNSRLPSIFLSPIYQRSPLRSNSTLGYEQGPQLHLALRLKDDKIDVEVWNDWLRLMPEGIKDVRVDGPFLSAYR